MKHWLTNSLLAATGLGAVTLLGSLWHAQAYTVRRRTIVLPTTTGDAPATPGQAKHAPAQLRILHISDIHLLASQRKRRAFLHSLAQLEPDFVVFTGDLISENDAISALAEDLKELAGIPGAFVFGSNDYYRPTLKNPFTYLFRHTGISDASGTSRESDASGTSRESDASGTSRESDASGTSSGKIPEKYQPLNTTQLRSWLTDCDWLDMNNSRAQVRIGDWQLDLVGVDDPHIGLDQFPDPVPDTAPDDANNSRMDDGDRTAVEHRTDVVKKLRIGLAHAPYQRILHEMAADGTDLLFAGHTHGGQVNLPGSRALVTNCDLPTRFANGLFSWDGNPAESAKYVKSAESADADAAEVITKNGAVLMGEDMLVNISAGIGTSPFTPVRTFCAPEAIILDVVSAE